MEHEPGEDLLAGTSLAHAEMNARSGKLRWRGHDGARLTIWSTLEPCLMCAGSIRLAPIAEVRYLAPDPLFAGVQEARHLNDFIASRWPEVQGPRTDELAVFGLLLPAHVGAFWGAVQAGWTEALPAISALAADLARTEELVAASHRGMRVDELAGRPLGPAECGDRGPGKGHASSLISARGRAARRPSASDGPVVSARGRRSCDDGVDPATATVHPDPVDGAEVAEASDPAYPKRWESDVALADGGTMHVRPIRPDDADRSCGSTSASRRRASTSASSRPGRAVALPTSSGSPTSTTSTGSAFVGIGRRRLDRGRPLRPVPGHGATPRSRSSSTTSITAEGSPPCCSSTSRWPRGRPGSPASRRRSCRRTAGCSVCSPRPASRLSSRFEDGVMEVAAGHRADSGGAGRHRGARQGGRCALGRASAAPALDRGGRRIPAPGHRSATRCSASCSRHGFEGPVYPVNPQADHVAEREGLAHRARPAGRDRPGGHRGARASEVRQIVEQCAAKRVQGLVVISSGFARGRRRRCRSRARAGAVRPAATGCA